MKLRMLTCILVALSMLGLAPAAAHAGLLYKKIDVLYLTPEVGWEVARVGFAGIDPMGVPTSGSYVASGFSFGALAGVRLGPINLGANFQRTLASAANSQGLNLNKLYGELGLDISAGIMVAVLHFDFGWAFAQLDQAPTLQGFGGKLGLALDFYPLRWLSVGPGADFDVQGFSTATGFTAAYGGTFMARVGFHL